LESNGFLKSCYSSIKSCFKPSIIDLGLDWRTLREKLYAPKCDFNKREYWRKGFFQKRMHCNVNFRCPQNYVWIQRILISSLMATRREKYVSVKTCFNSSPWFHEFSHFVSGSLFFWYNTLNVKNKVRYILGISPKIFQHFAFIFHYLFWFHIATVPNTTRLFKFRHLLNNYNRDVTTMENDCWIICFN
jgi:hypothetical protein